MTIPNSGSQSPKMGIIVPKDSDNILDLYNVDYVCKVEFVNGDFIVEKLEDERNVKDEGA